MFIYWLSYDVVRMICLTTGRAQFYIQRKSYANSFKLAANLWKLWRVNFLSIEISYDCVVIGRYGTRTKNSCGKLSFPFSWFSFFFKFSFLYHLSFLTGIFDSGFWKMFVNITNKLEPGLNLLGQARSFHACWIRMLYHDSLETIENSQGTN